MAKEKAEHGEDKSIPKVIVALLAVKDHISKTGSLLGKIPCQCGGEITYTSAKINGHVRANCPSCGLSFME